MLRLTSLFPSAPLADAPSGELRLPRKRPPEPLENEERPTFTNAPDIAIQEVSLRPALLAGLSTDEAEVINGELSESIEGEQCVQTFSMTLETTHSDPESDFSDAHSEFSHFEVERVDHTITSVTTTTRSEEQTTTVPSIKRTVLSQQDGSTISLQSAPDQLQRVVRTFDQGGIQRKTSFYREPGLPRRAPPGQSCISAAAGDGRRGTSSSSSLSVREKIVQIEHLHREEKDHILALLTRECEDYKRASEELRKRNEELLQKVIASASRIAQLHVELTSLRDTHPTSAETDYTSTAITTTITTITTTLITVTTRIEDWKRKLSKNTGHVTISVEELDNFYSDLSASASQMADLQPRYEELSRGLSSVRMELQAAVSLQEEKDRSIVSLTREIAEKTQQIAIELRNNELLERDLSVRSEELFLARNELQSRVSIIDERDRTIAAERKGNEELGALRDQLREALAEKDREVSSLGSEVEQLKRLGAVKAEGFETAQRELGQLRGEYDAASSKLRATTQDLTVASRDLEEWKRSDAAKSEELAHRKAKIAELQKDLSVSSSHVIELEQHNERWSIDVTSLREQLAATSSRGKVATLNKEIEKWKQVGERKDKDVIALRQEVDKLNRDLAVSADQIVEDRRLHAAQLTQLTTQVEEYKLSEAIKSEELNTVHEQLQQLQRDLSTSSTLVIKLQQREEVLSTELTSVHERLTIVSSNDGEKDRMIASLSAENKERTQSNITKTQELGAARGDLDRLRLDVTNEQRRVADSEKELASAHERIEQLSTNLGSVHDQLEASLSSIEDKDRMIAAQAAEINELKVKVATSAEELVTTRSDLEKLGRDLIADQERNAAESTKLAIQVEEWMRLDAAKAEELSTTRGNLEKLRSELVASATQIAVVQQRREAESAELTSRFEELKRSGTIQVEELATAREKIAQLEHSGTTSSSRVIELEQHNEMLSNQLRSVQDQFDAMSLLSENRDRAVAGLNEQIKQWKQADSAKVEELIVTRKELNELHRNLAVSTNQIVEEQRRHVTESAELTSQVEKWKGSDATRAQELINAHEQFAQLQLINATSSSRITELDQQNQTLSTTLTSLREQYEAASLCGKDKDGVVTALSAEIEQRKLTDIATKEELASTRDELDQVRRSLSMSQTQHREDQQRLAAELDKLAFELEKWKNSDAGKAEQLTSANERIEQLERKQVTSSTLIIELEQRNKMLSMHLDSLREQLEAMSLLSGDRDRTVAALNEQIERWKLVDGAKAEELIVARKDLEGLRHEMAIVYSRADATVKELTAAHESVDQLRHDLAMSSAQVVDDQERYTAQFTQLTTEVEEWKRSDSVKAQELALTREQLERLEDELLTSYSRVGELELQDQLVSKKLGSLREQLQAVSSCGDEKDRTISDLTIQIEKWEHLDTTKTEQLNVTRKELDQLRVDLAATTAQAAGDQRHAAEAAQQLISTQEKIKQLEYDQSTSSSLTIELTQRNETQPTQLDSLREQLEAMMLLSGDRDRALVELNAQIKKWKSADSDKAEELIALRKEIDQLRRNLAAATDQTAQDQQRHAAEIAELTSRVGEWKSSCIAKADELAVAERELEQLQRLTAELQQREESLSTKLTSLREEHELALSNSDQKDITITRLSIQTEEQTRVAATKAQELDVACRELHDARQHTMDLAKELASAHENDKQLSTELGSLREQLQATLSSVEDKDRTIAIQIGEIEAWQAKYDAQAGVVTATRNDLEARVEELERSYATKVDELNAAHRALDQLRSELASNLEEWKHSDTTLATTRETLTQLEQNLSMSSSTIIELQQHKETLSMQLTSLREQFEAMSSLGKDRDHTVATLNQQIEQWKQADSAKADKLIDAHQELEHLRQELAGVSSQANATAQELTVAQQNIDQLHHDLSVLSAQGVEEHQRHVEESTELTSQVQAWQRSDTLKAEELHIACEQLEQHKQGLTTTSLRLTELQQRYEAQSTELSSVRKELQDALSYSKDRDRMIATYIAEIGEWKAKDADQMKELEQLHRELNTSSALVVQEQQRHQTESTELTRQVEQWKRLNRAKADELGAAYKHIEQLRSSITSLSTQIIENQDRHAADLAAFASQLEQWELTDATSTEELAVAYERVERCIRSDVVESASTELNSLHSQLEEQRCARAARAETLSAELAQYESAASVERTSLLEGLDAAEAELAEFEAQLAEWHGVDAAEVAEGPDAAEAESVEFGTQLAEWKDLDATETDAEAELTPKEWMILLAARTEEVVNTHEKLEQLHRDSSTTSSHLSLTEFQWRYKSKSTELARRVEGWKRLDTPTAKKLCTAYRDLEQLRGSMAATFARIIKHQQRQTAESERLASELEKSKDSYASKAKELASAHVRIQASSTSILELKQRNETLSAQLGSLHEQLEAMELLSGDKDRTVTVVRGELQDSVMELASAHEKIRQLSTEFNSVCERLQAASLSVEEKEHVITTHTTEIERLKAKVTAQTEELVAHHNNIEQLRRDLIIVEEHHAAEATRLAVQVEEWKRSDSAKAEELGAAHGDLDQLRSNLAASVTQIADAQRLHAELTSRFEELRRSDTTKAGELATAREKFVYLEDYRSTSSSHTIELEQHGKAQSVELSSLRAQLAAMSAEKDCLTVDLNDQIEHWRLAHSAKAEEFVGARKELGQLQEHLDSVEAEFSSQLKQWERLDAAKTVSMELTSEELAQFQQHYDAQSTELESLRQQLHIALVHGEDKDRLVTTLNDQLEQWKRADSTTLDKVKRAQAELEKVWRKLPATPDTTPAVGGTAIVDLTNIVDGWVRADKKRAQDLTAELANRDKEIKDLRDRLVALKKEHEEQLRALKSALAERQSQLDGVQRFVTSADSYADTVIIQALQKLDAEVHHSTTIMADIMLDDFQPRAEVTVEQSTASESVAKSIGHALAGCLVQQSADELALYLQIAFQGFLSNHLGWIISSWTIGEEQNDLIDGIYDRLQVSETQTVYGRWRALTRAHITDNPGEHTNNLIAATVEGLSDIVLVAGCAVSISDAKSKLSSRFNDKVSGIILLAERFRKMIGEVVSSDFAVLAARPAQVFEEDTMEEDVEDDDGRGTPSEAAAGQKVVCSTHLGLTKRMLLESGEKKTLTVVKTKVILESFLHEDC